MSGTDDCPVHLSSDPLAIQRQTVDPAQYPGIVVRLYLAARDPRLATRAANLFSFRCFAVGLLDVYPTPLFLSALIRVIFSPGNTLP